MKIKLPKPFYTARVGEALSSLTNYVREASLIADEIKPVLFSDPHLVPDPDAVPPAPKLHNVKVSPIPSSLAAKHFAFGVIVNGKNLENLHSFALIPAHDLSDGSYSTNAFFTTAGQSLPPPPASISSVFAGFTQHVPQPTKKHRYHAWVQDSFGQEDLLFNALP